MMIIIFFIFLHIYLHFEEVRRKKSVVRILKQQKIKNKNDIIIVFMFSFYEDEKIIVKFRQSLESSNNKQSNNQ
jgi:predicted MPP superfamily phosphohydrolase